MLLVASVLWALLVDFNKTKNNFIQVLVCLLTPTRGHSQLIDCRRNGVIAERDLQLRVHAVLALAVRAALLQGVTVHLDAEHFCVGVHLDGDCY